MTMLQELEVHRFVWGTLPRVLPFAPDVDRKKA